MEKFRGRMIIELVGGTSNTWVMTLNKLDKLGKQSMGRVVTKIEEPPCRLLFQEHNLTTN